MKRILSFGGGLQTTALAIMVAKGELEVDEVVFADTGAEKPETYWYMATYIQPLFLEKGLSLIQVREESQSHQPDLYGWLWRREDIPSITQRVCSVVFKIRPIQRHIKRLGWDDVEMIIGFSKDEEQRTQKSRWSNNYYPLIAKNMTASDCNLLIQNYGWPVPLKSSCFFCPYQHPIEWNWLKNNHPDLFNKAIALEKRFHERRPQWKDTFGLLRGTPLWKMKDGLQPEMFTLMDGSCWSGHCGH